jgi:hypothetical protein
MANGGRAGRSDSSPTWGQVLRPGYLARASSTALVNAAEEEHGEAASLGLAPDTTRCGGGGGGSTSLSRIARLTCSTMSRRGCEARASSRRGGGGSSRASRASSGRGGGAGRSELRRTWTVAVRRGCSRFAAAAKLCCMMADDSRLLVGWFSDADEDTESVRTRPRGGSAGPGRRILGLRGGSGGPTALSDGSGRCSERSSGASCRGRGRGGQSAINCCAGGLPNLGWGAAAARNGLLLPTTPAVTAEGPEAPSAGVEYVRALAGEGPGEPPSRKGSSVGSSELGKLLRAARGGGGEGVRRGGRDGRERRELEELAALTGPDIEWTRRGGGGAGASGSRGRGTTDVSVRRWEKAGAGAR